MQRVHMITLGCARNDVDSDELAGRLAADGFVLSEDAEDADVVVVNTCGFVDAAKKDSIDTILAQADLKGGVRGPKAVVAVGCLAERYGRDLAAELPEADAVLGFDSYNDIGDRLRRILGGEHLESHVPHDRRALLPIAPADRAKTVASAPVPRLRLDHGPCASLKIAAGCDRRCTFCAIPMFRGAYQSRRPHEVIDEARWLADQGVRELFLVSENSTSYGKDLGDLRLLESLLPELAEIDGIERVRVSYLQPAEMRPGLIDVITSTPKVVPYFDLSFQHASATVLRRMRRFGGVDEFLDLVGRIRKAAPSAGIRSNFIVGFPGETEQEFDELIGFLTHARLDYVGVFGYSDEDGTEAEGFAGKLDSDEVDARVETLTELTDELCNQRAEDRVGERVRVLVERVDGQAIEGRAAHQGPEVDGTTRIEVPASVGDFVDAVVVATDGVDLIAELS
jgi:ribosomal protein S12 methylthiotransferase